MSINIKKTKVMPIGKECVCIADGKALGQVISFRSLITWNGKRTVEV